MDNIIHQLNLVDTKSKSKKRKQKKINGLPKSLFDRLKFINTFEADANSNIIDSSIMESYVPRLLNSCNTSCRLPEDPLDMEAFRRVITLPGRTPYFKYPNLPSKLQPGRKKSIIIQNTYPSLIPLLMTAHHAGISTNHYHVVSQRNSLRKMAMNDEDFVINAVRFGSTLYLRRFASYRTSDKNNVGFRFEQMCTTNNSVKLDYNQLTEGRIGKFKILMLGETDAINKDNGESIELKCQKKELSKSKQHDWWLQAYMSATDTIIHGRFHKEDPTMLSSLKEYKTSMLSDEPTKNEMFDHLHCVLQFLFSNVNDKRIYMLRGSKDQSTNRRVIRLYEVVDKNDKEKLSFVTDKLLNTLSATPTP